MALRLPYCQDEYRRAHDGRQRHETDVDDREPLHGDERPDESVPSPANREKTRHREKRQDRDAESALDPARTCAYRSAVLKAILSLEVRDRSVLLRAMMAGLR